MAVDWIKPSVNEGSGGATVELTADMNLSAQERSGIILVNTGGGGSKALDILQYGSWPVMPYSPYEELRLDPVKTVTSRRILMFSYKSGTSVNQGTVGVTFSQPFVTYVKKNGLKLWNEGTEVTIDPLETTDVYNPYCWYKLFQITKGSILEIKIGETWETAEDFFRISLE